MRKRLSSEAKRKPRERLPKRNGQKRLRKLQKSQKRLLSANWLMRKGLAWQLKKPARLQRDQGWSADCAVG